VTTKAARPLRGHLPRIYDVPGEPLALRIWTGTEDIWYSLTWPEARCLHDDLHDALMRRFRAVESGQVEPSAVPIPVPTRR
jgi:hypothetical protein